MSSGEADEAPLWGEVEPHLDRALELEPREREAWLAELGAQRPMVAASVRALLRELKALDSAGFMLAPAAPRVGGIPEVLGVAAGDTVGPYRLIREIGHGGMSSVWLAERHDGQLKRHVALKLPLLGAWMRIERFVHERDILAALTHPNIARLYDAGTSESGQPYLAMEYVPGTALSVSCDERCLTIRERLLLFVQVLQAVQFAHAELIIHRDLKPSNILVTAQGRVALLDFGISKFLSNGQTNDTPVTQLGGRACTPDYASPEQITGQSLGTASDIYSLGVILYELLTGNRPYQPARDSRAALEEAILQNDLRRPSQSGIEAQAAAARGVSARSLARALGGDLDSVVLKALRRNPVDRYPSASAFAQDITNYLEGLPVSARPESSWYRVVRFSSRHRTSVIAAGIAAFALLGGAGLVASQARTAAAERDRAVTLASRNEAVTAFLGRIITEAAESAQPVTVSEMLARSEKLALADRSSNPENRAAVLGMIAERYASLDDSDRAAQLLQKALEIVGNSPDRALRARLSCARAQAVATFANSERSVQAISRELQGLAVAPEAASHCLLALARIEVQEHHNEDALRQAQLGLARAREGRYASGETEAALLGEVAFTFHLNNRNVDAEGYFRQALRLYTNLGQERSDGALTMLNDWAVSLLNAGVPARALQLLQRAERIDAEREAGSEPATSSVGNEAVALVVLGRFEQARGALEHECRLARQRKDDLYENHCILGFAALTLQMHSFEESQRYLDRATHLMAAAPADSLPALTGAQLQGSLDLAAGRFEQARGQFHRALASRAASPSRLSAQLGIAELDLTEGNPAAGMQDARAALETATSLQGGLPYSSRTGLALLAMGRASQELGNTKQAKNELEDAITHLSNTVDADHPALLQARQLLSTL
jgi:serine/threonine-protein kinase